MFFWGQVIRGLGPRGGPGQIAGAITPAPLPSGPAPRDQAWRRGKMEAATRKAAQNLLKSTLNRMENGIMPPCPLGGAPPRPTSVIILSESRPSPAFSCEKNSAQAAPLWAGSVMVGVEPWRR